MTRWRTPTRRTFFAMLGAGVAALAASKLPELARPELPAAEATPPAPDHRTLWIGHC